MITDGYVQSQAMPFTYEILNNISYRFQYQTFNIVTIISRYIFVITSLPGETEEW